jgi:hypothetical protein
MFHFKLAEILIWPEIGSSTLEKSGSWPTGDIENLAIEISIIWSNFAILQKRKLDDQNLAKYHQKEKHWSKWEWDRKSRSTRERISQ